MAEFESRVSEVGSSKSEPTSLPTNSVETSQGLKIRKSVQYRSTAWDHFEKFKDDNGGDRAKCKHCGCDYKLIHVLHRNVHLAPVAAFLIHLGVH